MLKKAKARRKHRKPDRDPSWDSASPDVKASVAELETLVADDPAAREFLTDLAEYFDVTSAVLIMRFAKSRGLIAND